jgi:c-di-GMP-binding flagellar brake protein YcgR
MSRHNDSNDRRSAPRVAVPLDKPVYIQRNVDGLELSLLVENLSESGAMLICPELNEPFQTGEDFGDCILVLPGIGHASVKAVIRWAMWPKVGVEFDRISKRSRQQIIQFLNSVGKLSQNQNTITVR